MRRLIMLVLVSTPAFAAEPPGITVEGMCTARATPDRGRLSAWAERDAPDATKAAADAATALNKFRQDVDALKLPGASLEAGGVQILRITGETDAKGAAKSPYYRATAQLTIETSDIAGLAQAMRAAASDGIDNVAPIDAFLSDGLHDKLVTDCLARAASDAHTKAEAVLRGIGATLGPVTQVAGYQVSGGEQPRPLMRAAPMALAAMPLPSVSAGPQTLTVSVNITFAITPGH